MEIVEPRDTYTGPSTEFHLYCRSCMFIMQRPSGINRSPAARMPDCGYLLDEISMADPDWSISGKGLYSLAPTSFG